MLKNKVHVFIDGVSTMALVDTGATISVMSVLFKSLLGRKVMFRWDQNSSFRGVSGDSLYPVGVCNVNVSLGGKVFNAEFTVLPRSTHDVIQGIDFLQLCGANVDCRTGELSVSASVSSVLFDHPPCEERVFCVSDGDSCARFIRDACSCLLISCSYFLVRCCSGTYA